MLQLKVSGMTCGHCVSAVTRAASEVSGAKDVKVDLNHGLVTVDGNPNPAAYARRSRPRAIRFKQGAPSRAFEATFP